MTLTENLIDGSGSNTYNFTFPILELQDVRVQLREFDPSLPEEDQIISQISTTAFDVLSSPSRVVFQPIADETIYQDANGDVKVTSSNGYQVVIRIYRATDIDGTTAYFYPGSAIRAEDLNDNFKQLLFNAQETDAELEDILGGIFPDDSIPGSSLKDGAVTTEKLADGAVTTEKLADGAVTPDKLDREYVEVAGDNMTGDLTLGTDKIELKAADGSASFTGAISIGNAPYTDESIVLDKAGYIYLQRPTGAGSVFVGANSTTETSKIGIDGSAEFAGDVTVGDTSANVGDNKAACIVQNGAMSVMNTSSNGSTKTFSVYQQGVETYEVAADGTTYIGGTVPSSPNISLSSNGSITAAGKVTSASTETNDSGTTLVTKDYIDSIPAGGVTKIVAGENVTISPADGTGVVTVNSTGGSGPGPSPGPGPETKADIYGTAKAWGQVGSNGVKVTGTNFTVVKSGNGVYRVSFETTRTDSDYSITLGAALSNKMGINWSSKDSSGFTVNTFISDSAAPADLDFGFDVFDNEPAEIIVGSGTVANTNIYGTAKAWGNVDANGTLAGGLNAVVTRTGTGAYAVTFPSPMPDDNYSLVFGDVANGAIRCYAANETSRTANGFTYITINSTNSNEDFGANFTVHDNTPAEVALTTFGDVINYSGAAAWADTDADGTVKSALNLTLLGVNGGAYSYQFQTPMPSNNYSVVASSRDGSNAVDGNALIKVSSQSAAGFTLIAVNFPGGTPTLAGPVSHSVVVNALNALPPKGGTGTDSWATVDETTVNGPCNVPASFNVASVTRTALGVYDVVLTTPMPTNKYSVTTGSPVNGQSVGIGIASKTKNSFTVIVYNGASSVSIDAAFDFQVNSTNAKLPNSFSEEQLQTILDQAQSGVTNPGASAWEMLQLMERLRVA